MPTIEKCGKKNGRCRQGQRPPHTGKHVTGVMCFSILTQKGSKMKSQNAHCPICKQKIGLPVWVMNKYSKLYTAYCKKCQRAFKTKEVLWK